MKLFKIGELSKLYGISVDILRHYEKLGLFSPEHIKQNGYRLYSNNHIWILNTIRTLRSLDIGLSEIKKYFDERTFNKSMELIEIQLDVVDSKIEELQKIKEQLQQRNEHLKRVKSITEFEKFEVKTLRPLRVYAQKTDVRLDEDLDKAHREIVNQFASKEYNYFGTGKIAAQLNQSDFQRSDYKHYSKAFILHENGEESIKGGLYLVTFFKGDYSNTKKIYTKIKKYLAQNSFILNGDIIEIYLLDIHESDLRDEYITEIRVPIKKASK